MKGTKRKILCCLLFSALLAVAAGQALSRYCIKEPTGTTTRWGGNERIEIDMRDVPISSVSGIVLWPEDSPLGDSLVQVFPRKHSAPLNRPSEEEYDVPAAACLTGNDGLFAFSLSSGEYELRVSLNKGIDVT